MNEDQIRVRPVQNDGCFFICPDIQILELEPGIVAILRRQRTICKAANFYTFY